MRKKVIKDKSDESEQLARALADYDNLRKRVEREQEQASRVASVRVAAKLLPVYDMLGEIQGHLEDSGLAIAIGEFEEALGELGVKRIEVKVGTKFDEDLHECVEVVKKDGVGGNVIVEERQSGWVYENGMVVRAAKVVVNKSKGDK